MALRSVITTLALATSLAAPARAAQHERHHQDDKQNQTEQSARESEQKARARADSAQGDRAVARTVPPREAQRQEQVRREEQARIAEQQRRADESRRNENNRSYDNSRRYEDDNRRYEDDNRRYDTRGHGYANGWRRYDARNRYYYYYAAPRYVRPTIVYVVPYRPYVYRPSFSTGVYYGSGGYYPYGYTPRAYYDPIPGRPYGGVRITGAPRDALVFADGYFVGIVDDFDGVFQHINLEAGLHHIEVQWGGYQPIAFDVYVRPGETTTFRADRY